MARRVFLPLTDRLTAGVGPPSASAMRERLGGRLGAGPSPGTVAPGAIVSVRAGVDSHQVGVLLCVESDTVDVYLERGLVKRTQPDQIVQHTGASTPEQERVARDVRVFQALSEGQGVIVEGDDGVRVDGTLREKCRYGALVETTAGRLLAVGFRRLWPQPAGQAPS